MSRRWMQRRSGAWAPRALAVLSCALALLAAQPAMAAKPEASPVLLSSTVPAGVVARVEQQTPLLAAGGEVRRQTAFFGSSRRLHILATVEVLKRLLLAELRPAIEPVFMPVLLTEWTGCIELLEAPLKLPGSRGAPDFPAIPPPEHQFILRHTQLAPPTV